MDAAVEVRELRDDELGDWDAAAVDAEGGHVYQSRAWARHRAARGWRPRFLAVGAVRALVLVRPWPGLPGGSAYVTRGPVGPTAPWGIGGSAPDEDAGRTVGEALHTIGPWLAARGVDVLAADPEVAEDDGSYRRALRAGGFRPIPEIQPSRHRMRLRLAGEDEAAAFGAVAKGTRQRIREAERRVVVVRHDADPRDREPFLVRGRDTEEALDRFHALMVEAGRRHAFDFPGPGDFRGWWRRSISAGHAVYLEAREGGRDGEVLGGLLLYRHGSRLSTQHAADVVARRADRPGTMHLLRWRAIQLAIAEGRTELDMGGVDVAGARRIPARGEPTYGLYEHKRSFGAEWLALAGAHERVARGWRYAAGRATTRAARALGPRRAATR